MLINETIYETNLCVHQIPKLFQVSSPSNDAGLDASGFSYDTIEGIKLHQENKIFGNIQFLTYRDFNDGFQLNVKLSQFSSVEKKNTQYDQSSGDILAGELGIICNQRSISFKRGSDNEQNEIGDWFSLRSLCVFQDKRTGGEHYTPLPEPIRFGFCINSKNITYINPLGPNKYFTSPKDTSCDFDGETSIELSQYDHILDLNSSDIVLDDYTAIIECNSSFIDDTSLNVVVDYDEIFF